MPEWLKIFSNAQRVDAKRNVKLVCPVVMSACRRLCHPYDIIIKHRSTSAYKVVENSWLVAMCVNESAMSVQTVADLVKKK